MTMAYHNQLGGAIDFVIGSTTATEQRPCIRRRATSVAFSPSIEPGVVIANPHLSPSGTPTTRHRAGSTTIDPPAASTAIRDACSSTAGDAPYPGVDPRTSRATAPSMNGAWDIGPYQHPGMPATPTANFTSGAATFCSCADRGFSRIFPWAGPTVVLLGLRGRRSFHSSQPEPHVYGHGLSQRFPHRQQRCLQLHLLTRRTTSTHCPYCGISELTPPGAASRSTVTFSDYSSGALMAWNWNFGDGIYFHRGQPRATPIAPRGFTPFLSIMATQRGARR